MKLFNTKLLIEEQEMKKCIVCDTNNRAKYHASCDSCNGLSFVSTLSPIGDTNLIVDYPSNEKGSNKLIIGSIEDLKEADCFNGLNNITIYDTSKQSIFAEHLKKFFGHDIVEIDGFTNEQNRRVVKEIHSLLDARLDELNQVFFDTVSENIALARTK